MCPAVPTVSGIRRTLALYARPTLRKVAWTGIAVLVAVVAAFAVSAFAIARPTRVVALFAPMFGLYLLAQDFTYDNYYAPSLERYWNEQGEPGRMLVGLVIALVAGGVAYRWPREGGVVTLVALPVIFVVAVVASIGH
jgi:uncharacterized membrane protein